MTKITTDVDRILDYVKTRQRAEIVEIARALNIKAGDVDKWAKVLEREGVVRIEYNITKMYIVWAGKGGVLQSAHAYEEPRSEPTHKHIDKEITPVRTDSGKMLPKPSRQSDAESGKTDAKQHKHTPPSRPSQQPRNAGDAEESKRLQQQPAHNPREQSGSPRVAVMFRSLLPPKAERVPPHVDTPKKAEQKQPAEVPEVDLRRAQEVSELLKSKVEAINATVAEISDLKAEKEKLYSTEYATLLSRFDSQLSTLSEKIAEREAALLALKQRVAGLPEQAARAEDEMKSVSSSFALVQAEYEKQLAALSKLRGEIVRERESIKSDISRSRSELKSSLESISGIEESISSVNSMREHALRRVEEARRKIAEETALVDKMASLVEQSGAQLDELNAMLRNMLERAQSAQAVLDKVESYDAKLAEAERMLAQVESEYSKKISELKKAAQVREAEISKLRVEAEQAALQKYVNEISRMSRELEQEAEAASRKEREIEERLKAAKARLQQLLKESRELSEKFEDSI